MLFGCIGVMAVSAVVDQTNLSRFRLMLMASVKGGSPAKK